MSDTIKCGRCDKEGSLAWDSDESLDTQEWLRYSDTGGYFSKIGDEVSWSLCLCQECTLDVLKPYIEVVEES